MTDARQTPPGTFSGADMTLAARQGRWAAFWDQFKDNRMAVAGMIIFAVFFATALAGLALTSGARPILNPSTIRLQEKLRPPLSKAAVEVLKANQVPAGGVYLLGTDDLGRDVFARMMQGAWVSLTVGFVAVGISIAIGIFLGGISGYYGQLSIGLHHVMGAVLPLAGATLAGSVSTAAGLAVAVAGLAWLTGGMVMGARAPVLARRLCLPLMTIEGPGSGPCRSGNKLIQRLDK